ncbi:DUF4124 domain-containing protein [Denitrificimonas sp. JX-1]|uniref:DUF4124 domain-containing protein n=1 Tax=Denitrificimonas halotolerans TaxID=3098930 RepID=A0ABU5GQJ6_9GAMM|nr:DUF4124 domain-containing protein [Denitrificimonas sp. JX-1]MDY7219233.1 DUF4124 domain-containing protein [Denitrificimonas sp. JX-1]
MRSKWVLMLLGVLPHVSAQIYHYIDEQGIAVFSDQPITSIAHPISQQPINRIPAFTPQQIHASQPLEPTSTTSSAYQTLHIAGLPTDHALRANAGRFSITIEIQPELAPDHRLQLLINDQPYTTANRSLLQNLNNLPRGKHRIAVQVLNMNGEVLQRSTEFVFHLQRFHINQPHSKNSLSKQHKPHHN